MKRSFYHRCHEYSYIGCHPNRTSPEAPHHFPTLRFGTLLFFGWISGLIFGKTFKALPFIVWNHHYKEVHGQKHVPLPKDLYSEKLIRAQFWLFLMAGFALAAGIFLNMLWITKGALFIWVLVALLYVYNVGGIIAHTKTHRL